MASKRFVLLALVATATAVATGYRSSNTTCRVLPGDAAWPSTAEWSNLNKTLDGRLIASQPLSAVCHNGPLGTYDAGECANLQSIWDTTDLSQINSPAEVLSQNFQNYSCVPFTPRSQSCNLGNYVSYVVNVTGVDDVRATIKFAKEKNIRIVIKNTGHDYLGKSTGKGGLSIWTHNLKSTQYIPTYNSSYYTGPAAKLGAGIEGYEAYKLALDTGNRIVGGTCPTVGIVGGYTQGGGHSLLSSSSGMGADNVLEWEVVTMDGKHLIATPEKNSDLYWALSGGGPGTFAVVLSMTARLHKDSIVGGTVLQFNDSAVGNDAYWDAVAAWHALLPAFLDAGNSFTYSVGNKEFAAYGTMPGADLDKINTLLKPFLDDLMNRGITPQNTPRVADNYYNHFYDYLGPAPLGSATEMPFTNSRIFPRNQIVDKDGNKVFRDLLRNVSLIEGFSPFYCNSFNVSNQVHPDNAVLPAWRDGIAVCAPAGAWDWKATPEQMRARDDYAANVLQPMLDAATPGGGVYLNEANHLYKNWKEGFYGSNYGRLMEVKNKYDPQSLLYVRTGVGSEAWSEDGSGRLCRVS